MARLPGARLDRSDAWAVALRGNGLGRERALLELRAHLVAAASFELGRRGAADDGVDGSDAALLVRNAAENALAAAFGDLARYRGQSAFTTWTAKYAIHEAAAAARSWRGANERTGRPPGR